jgi:PPK2 family polyphosphate:nucleotide phosphotransferase
VGLPVVALIQEGRVVWKKYRVESGRGFKLKRFDPDDTDGFDSKEKAEARLRTGLQELCRMQDVLYAQDRWALLLIFQAMDAAGKDSTIKHVMSGLNPQGCEVHSFKAPSPEELDHDFLWRTNCRLPGRGAIGVFNRSYYEEVLVVRVHPEILAGQKLPPPQVTRRIWDERYEDIRAFEGYLTRQGTVIRKFFLHVSKEEQRRRFLERLDHSEKNWKFSAADVKEREHWNEYQKVYAQAIASTSTPESPWYVVPADHKWFTRMVVADVVVETLRSLQLRYPTLSPKQKAELASARKRLERA